MCPSSHIDNRHAELLGVPTPDGLQFVDKPLPITDEFRAIAKRGRDPGRRFRFTSPCKERGCPQWNEGGAGGGRCGVSDAVTEELSAVVTTESDWQRCPIRDRCQWRTQSGDAACRVCTEVITNLFVDEPRAASEPAGEVPAREGEPSPVPDLQEKVA